MIVADANVLLSAVLGVRTLNQLDYILDRGVDVSIPAPQAAEARRVLTEKRLSTPRDAEAALAHLGGRLRLLELPTFAAAERDARARLHERAQSDWPVLAAALTFDAAIWSNDRDFFGVGVPVWSTRNIALAAPGAL